jgi:myosin-crossreactive antigen
LLYEELDEFAEVLFFQEGSYNIGYSINRKEHFPMRLNGCQVIGSYGVTFNKRSLFIYKTVEKCKGFFVRKLKWL